MSEEMKMENIDLENLEGVAGGNDGLPSGNWAYGTVHGVVAYDSTACLTLRDAPGGNVMYTSAGKAMGWQNDDSIPVLPSSRNGDWIKAKYGTVVGWTNANYVWY